MSSDLIRKTQAQWAKEDLNRNKVSKIFFLISVFFIATISPIIITLFKMKIMSIFTAPFYLLLIYNCIKHTRELKKIIISRKSKYEQKVQNLLLKKTK